MSRSQISKLHLTMTRLERKREKLIKKIEKLIATGRFIDDLLNTYREVVDMDKPVEAPVPFADPINGPESLDPRPIAPVVEETK